MKKAGYALIRKSDGASLAWWEAIPLRIDTPEGDVIFGATVGWTLGDYEITEEEREFADPPDVNPVLPAPLITRKQLILGLLADGFISMDEAVAAAQNGAVPAAIQAIFDTVLETPMDRAKAIVTWASMRDVLRTDPLTRMIQQSRGMTDEQVDEMWARWATL
ncbi:hypothetical protein [Rhodopseudomonas palustris]|uniref:hypothetical protein n=1 Tax=Rhodopseudomonas palustris TaxID=1076 RepID=UPI0021F35D78|nr:hypothetical protein [Rhodopseudomonas palustris]UYO52493.1 hypothetical protein KQX61_18115 [Rhodopseudomonas palustris]